MEEGDRVTSSLVAVIYPRSSELSDSIPTPGPTSLRVAGALFLG